MTSLQVADDQPLKQMLLTQCMLPDLKPLVETVGALLLQPDSLTDKSKLGLIRTLKSLQQ